MLYFYIFVIMWIVKVESILSMITTIYHNKYQNPKYCVCQKIKHSNFNNLILINKKKMLLFYAGNILTY